MGGDKSDGTLGYALTMLPKSFFITQTLRIREPLGSADVTGAYTEWERRRTTDSRTALSVKRNNNESDDNKTRKAFLVQIRQLLVKHKARVTVTPNCFVKHLKRVKAEGRVAVTSNPTDNLIAKRQHCRSMMLSMQLRIYCDNCRSIFHHRLWRSSHGADKNLLTGLQWITTKWL